MWFHFTQAGDWLGAGWLKASGTYGWVGVDAFFVISGFVLALALHRWKYRTGIDWLPFMIRRLVRLEPPYLLSVALTLGLWWLSSMRPGFGGTPPEWNWSQLASHVFYLTDLVGESWLNPVYWSLAIEFQFYIFLAVFGSLFLSGLATVYICIGVLLVSAVLFQMPVLLPSYFGLFCVGIVLFRRMVFSDPAWIVIPALVASISCVAYVKGIESAITVIVSGTVIAFWRGAVWRPLLWLGGVSYSLYLIHAPVGGRLVNLAARMDLSQGEQFAALAAIVAATLVFAWGFWRIAERPALIWSRSVGQRTRSGASLS